jgi:hypothetical protein
MTIDPETLAAFADGELNAIEATRVERAVASDPALAAQLAAHRALRDKLKSHFAPIAALPVPDRLSALLTQNENVVGLAQARESWTERAQRFRIPVWAASGAMAASLVVGLGIGNGLSDGAPMTTRKGTLVANGSLDRALTEQLASAQDGTAMRILVSFRQADGTLCRGFHGGGVAGIACRDKNSWTIRRAQGVGPETTSTYRQAGSAAADIMTAAQDMAKGGALDAAQEKAARDAGWRNTQIKP